MSIKDDNTENDFLIFDQDNNMSNLENLKKEIKIFAE